MGMLHERLNYINVHIFELGVPVSHPFIFLFDPSEWVNY